MGRDDPSGNRPVAGGAQRGSVATEMPLYSVGDYERVTAGRNDRQADYDPAWRQDVARLIHCAAFRRLQGKRQLIPNNAEADQFRSRLTHSLEVAHIAKTIASKINLSEDYFKRNNISLDLVEFASLAHDLGHPPFWTQWRRRT